jgi:HD-GYP domain-containing protein (c-di-GMP phosphodiesterase class II)
VADAYSAMMADRPYRKALTLDEARDELSHHAGKQFDPHLTQEFMALLDKGNVE